MKKAMLNENNRGWFAHAIGMACDIAKAESEVTDGDFDALAKDGGAIDYAIDVDVPDSDIVRRLSGRRVCLKCGATYHTSFNPPREEGICDSCGEALVHRDDDKPETIQKRLDVYHSQTQPLIEYYHEAGCMYKVDGTRSLEEVFASICAILE